MSPPFYVSGTEPTVERLSTRSRGVDCGAAREVPVAKML